jgi:hypothetical protein
MMRGHEVPTGQSAAFMRLRAHQQKMALRAMHPARAEQSEDLPQTKVGCLSGLRRSPPRQDRAVSVKATAQVDATKSASDTVNILQPTATGHFTVVVTATEGVNSTLNRSR